MSRKMLEQYECIYPIVTPIMGNLRSGGFSEVVGIHTFTIALVVHWTTSTTIQMRFSDDPDTISSAGWSAEINGVPTTLTYQSNQADIYTFMLGDDTQMGDVVTVSYDGTGDTLLNGVQCQTINKRIAVEDNNQSGYVWGAAGSLYMLTDGASTHPDRHVIYPQIIGVGAPAFVTPPALYTPDFEGVYREVAQNSPPWYGARKETNELRASWDFENAFWGKVLGGLGSEPIVTPNQTDPNGGTSAYRLQTDLGGGTTTTDQSTLYSTVSEMNDTEGVYAIWAKSNTASDQTILLNTATPLIVTCTPIWQRLTVAKNTAISGRFTIGARGGIGGDDVLDVTIWKAYLGSTEGKTNKAPPEDIETSNDPVTQYYSNYNGNTVLDNVVTEAEGAPLPVMPSLFGNGAVENLIPYSRDLTNPAWNPTGTPTVTYDQVGLTGEPNTASLISSVNTSVTEVLAESVPIPSNTDPYTVRLIIPKDNDISRQPELRLDLNTATRQRQDIRINTQTGELTAGYSAGAGGVFESVESGDDWEVYLSVVNVDNTAAITSIVPASGNPPETGEVAVLQVELHPNKTIADVKGSQPIFTEGAAVSQAAIQMPYDIANHSDGQGAYYCEFMMFEDGDVLPASQCGLIGQAARILYNQSNNRLRSFDGTNIASSATQTFIGNVFHKAASVYDTAEGLKMCQRESGAGADAVYSGSFNTTNLMVNSFWPFPSLIRNVRRYDLPYQEAKIKIDRLMGSEAPFSAIIGTQNNDYGSGTYYGTAITPNTVEGLEIYALGSSGASQYELKLGVAGDEQIPNVFEVVVQMNTGHTARIPWNPVEQRYVGSAEMNLRENLAPELGNAVGAYIVPIQYVAPTHEVTHDAVAVTHDAEAITYTGDV